MVNQIGHGEFECDDMTLVLGFGNPLHGDDGLGTYAIEKLMQNQLPPNVKVKDAGTPGFGLVSELEGWGRVILIDAMRMGQESGTWRRFGPEDVRLLAAEGFLSLHQPGLANGLALAQALDLLPDEIIFYGIEPADTSLLEGINPSVINAVVEVVENIIQEL
ncbi:MAG: hydrogenase maturation protease [Anaerolineales bacterium]|nr:hydrogenase maturation protease [Anaerolineales bacterium]